MSGDKGMSNKLDPAVKEKMKHEYVTSNIDQRALAEKYGTTLQTVSKYSKAENWVEERAKYFKRLEQKALELAQQRQLEKIVDRNDEHLAVWKLIGDKLKIMVVKVSKPQELYQLSGVMERLQKGERQALGLDRQEPISTEDAINAIRELNKHIQGTNEEIIALFEGEEDGNI